MHYHFATALDAKISVIAFGSVKLGRTLGVKYPTEFRLPTDQEVTRLLTCIYDLGINLIDTAPAYGIAEKRLGKLLNNRHNWLLASKVGEEFINGKSYFNFSYEAITDSIERSLRRLRTDYLDVLLLHSNGDDISILRAPDGTTSDAVRALQAAKQAGKVRAIGISTKTPAGSLEALNWCDCLMLEYSLAMSASKAAAQQAVIQKAATQGVCILAKKTLGSGHLLVNQQHKLAEALEYVYKQAISSIVLGSLSCAHWQENAACVDKIFTHQD